MRIKTKLLLRLVKHDKYIDVRNYLRKQLEENLLTGKQILYLIKNMNKNTYILQNVYPVAEAMKKGISISVIEECVSYLDDATELSIFSFKDGAGHLYNKVPDDLEKLLSLDYVKLYSDSLSWGKEFSKFSINCQQRIREITETLHQTIKLKTMSHKMFWTLVSNNNLDIIQSYNKIVQKRDKQNECFQIDDLLEEGMNLHSIAFFDYDKFDCLKKRLNDIKNEVIQSENIQAVILRSDHIDYCNNDYILRIDKIHYGKYDYPQCCYINSLNELDVVCEYNSRFNIILAKFSQSYYDEICEYTEEYIDEQNKLIDEQKKLRNELTICDKYIPEIMSTLSMNAWNGKGDREYMMTIGENTIQFEAYVYEPGWEYFSAECSITFNGKCLYGKDSRNVGAYHNEIYDFGRFRDSEEAIRYIKEILEI